MKAALLSLALLGNQTVLVSDRVPALNVEAMCKVTTADDKAQGIVLAQSFDSCMNDETAARKQLATLWPANSGSVRDQCEGEAVAGGIQSYVDLLTCIQMADWANPASKVKAILVHGASKNRNAN
jgi:hypothetical protein